VPYLGGSARTPSAAVIIIIDADDDRIPEFAGIACSSGLWARPRSMERRSERVLNRLGFLAEAAESIVETHK
jgi:hypothetical protein